MPIVEGQLVVMESQLARPTRPTYVQPHSLSPEQVYQEKPRQAVRTGNIEAQMAIQHNTHEMSEWFGKKREGWVKASEEFQHGIVSLPQKCSQESLHFCTDNPNTIQIARHTQHPRQSVSIASSTWD